MECEMMENLKEEFARVAPNLHAQLFPNRRTIREEYLTVFHLCFPFFTRAMQGNHGEAFRASDRIMNLVTDFVVRQSMALTPEEKVQTWERIKAAVESEAEALQLPQDLVNSAQQSQHQEDLDFLYAQLLLEDLSLCHRVFVVMRYV